ncbi:MAG TPA: acetylxylan esterase [Capsulimonadaceae bacterium]|jgi:cephalosporin-C deacetylase
MQDFDQYWAMVRADVAATDTDWDRTSRDQRVTANGGEWRIDWVRLSSVGNTLIWAWLAIPVDRPANKVGMLWLPGYSYGTPPPDATCLIPGVCTMGVNVHGNKPDHAYVNPAGKHDYIVNGIDQPETYIYRAISAHCLRAFAVLAEQPEVRKDCLVAAGMSQGAALAIIVAAQAATSRICFADMPFMANIRVSLSVSSSPVYKAFRSYSAHSGRDADLVDTLSLFDPMRHAPLVDVPTWLTAGGRDPAVKPETVESVYEAIKSSVKQYTFYPSAGHVFLPEMNEAHTTWVHEHILNKGA